LDNTPNEEAIIKDSVQFETGEKIENIIDNYSSADTEEIVKIETEDEDYLPNVRILVEEEGILIKKEGGKLELGEEVKEKIIRAFKEDPKDSAPPIDPPRKTSPRIFMRDDKSEGDNGLEEGTRAAAVKVIEEERKAHREDAGISLNEGTKFDDPMVKYHKKSKPTLAQAEVVMVKGADHALGLSYTPGIAPVVVTKEKGKKAVIVVEKAFILEIPVVEVLDWNTRFFNQLEVGKEIPENLYPVAAKALALVYRIKSGAHMIRFVKPSKKVKSRRKKEVGKRSEELREVMSFSRLSVEVGEELYKYSEDLDKQLELTSNRLTAEFGFPIPRADIKLVPSLKPGEYILKLKEVVYADGFLDLSYMPPELFSHLQSNFRTLVYNAGYELLGYAEVESLLNEVKKTNPGLLKSLLPAQLTIGALRFVLKGLLREKIPIRDMDTILETIEENIAFTNDPELLVEYIRSAFSRFISESYKDEHGNMNVFLLSHEVEQLIMESIRETMNVRWLDLQDKEGLKFLTNLGIAYAEIEKLGIPVVILTSPIIRHFIRKITEPNFPEIPVLAYSEITPMTPVKTVAVIKMGKE